MMKIGMLTSGGDCQALNAAMRGVVKGLTTNVDELEIYGFENGYKGLIYEQYRILTASDFSGILTRGGTILGSSRQPFKQMRVPDENGLDKVEAMKQNYYKLRLDCLVILGGNGTQKTANLLREEGLNIIHLPKTIDNDLALTDHTPGFGSAAKYIGASTKEVIRDAQGLTYKKSMITIMEIMGRNAGWLTGATALARTEDCDGPDLIYLPEVPFDIDKFLVKVKDLLKKKSSVVIAVSEGIRLADGRYVCELGSSGDYVDAFGHKQLAGTATYLANFLAAECGCKTRAVELSTLQRSASHMASRVDIDEAFMVGGAAVKAADEGDTGKMIVIDRVSDDPYMAKTGIYDVHRIANEEKVVPRNWMNKDASYVTKDFVDYISPLIQGDYQPIMVNGLPRHLVLNLKKKR